MTNLKKGSRKKAKSLLKRKTHARITKLRRREKLKRK